MAETIKKVILLDIRESSENPNDANIQVMDENHCFWLTAKGINKPNSKNRSNLLIGSLIEIEYFSARLRDKTSKLKKAHLLSDIDYNNSALLKFLQKIIIFLKQFAHYPTKNIFFKYQELLEFINDLNSAQYLFTKTYLVHSLLKPLGLEPNYYQCHVCGRKDQIVFFDYNKGGFECQEHSNGYKLPTHLLANFFNADHNFHDYLTKTTLEIDTFIYTKVLQYLKNNGLFIDWEPMKGIKKND
ncbi:DNA repair protein RecO C-terminal domain-containing protein [Mycoplasmopsis iners]|uniref:DNA repair protein RecO C-terminal domain-containing protein n=1 Tax=Mycoplasmopsis iners TaxID=76630 RepID=UPI000497007E|nr:DNA repair protein RecO C-terminal domain-containing protein [Mycoplasmopsis iners]